MPPVSSRAAAVIAVLLASGTALAQPDPEPAPNGKKDKTKKDKTKKVKVSGFVAALYKFRIEQNDDGTKDADVFRLAKVIVRVSGRISEWVGYTIEVDPRSPTLAGVMRDGYLSLHVIPGHEIRIGQQKTPFGYENWMPSRRLYTIYRSELSEGIGRGVTHRDIGVGLVGKRKLTECLRLEDAIAVVNGAGFGVQADDTEMKNVWGRVGLRYDNADLGLVVHAGVSGAFGDQMGEADPGPPPIPAERFAFKRLGGDLEIDHTWGFLGAEYASSWDEIPADSGDTERTSAWFITIAGKTPWHVGPVFRYDTASLEDFVRYTAGVYWGEPTAPVRVLLDYEYFEDEAGTHDGRVTTEAIVVF